MPKKMKPLTYQTRFRRFPPFVIRLLAREGTVRRTGTRAGFHYRRALTTAEIAERSGLPVGKVDEISRLDTWQHFPFGDQFMEPFLRGCNCDLNSRDWLGDAKDVLRRFGTNKALPKYLGESPEYEEKLLPLLTMMLVVWKKEKSK